MKKTLLTTLTILLSLALEVKAESYTVQRIGNFDYVNGSNGYSGTGHSIGGFYYYSDNQTAVTPVLAPQPLLQFPVIDYVPKPTPLTADEALKAYLNYRQSILTSQPETKDQQ